MSQEWGIGDDCEHAIMTIAQALMEEGLSEELVSENIEVGVIQGIRDKLYALDPQRDRSKLNGLLWYHLLLWRTAGNKHWTLKRSCGGTRVIPYHPILLEAAQNKVTAHLVLEGECLNIEPCVNEIPGGQGWKEITLLEFIGRVVNKYQDPSSTNIVPVITTPEQLRCFKAPTEREEEVDEVFTNRRNEAYILSNGDLRKLYSLRPAGLESMTFAEFIVDYYKKRSSQKAVIDMHTGLGEESGHKMIGTDMIAPLSMQLTNMIIMKRRTRNKPVPLFMTSEFLDNYGEQALFQPWRNLEELSNNRTEEEEQERRNRRLELFPMAVFPRIEALH